jgi:hypothetical protein
MYLFRRWRHRERLSGSHQKFQRVPLRYAISRRGAPQEVNVHADESLAAWERSVGDGCDLASWHTIAQAGYHVLKFWG